MFRIASLLLFITFFTSLYANRCDFSNPNQENCQIDIDNPPILLHKFIQDNKEIESYESCTYVGKLNIHNNELDVIDCSQVTNNSLLTEGAIFKNNGDTKKNITINNDNILLLFAGKLEFDKNIEFNTQNSKNVRIEVVHGKYNSANIIFGKDSKLNAKSIIIPKSEIPLISVFDCNNIENIFNTYIYAMDNDENLSPYKSGFICNNNNDIKKDDYNNIYENTNINNDEITINEDTEDTNIENGSDETFSNEALELENNQNITNIDDEFLIVEKDIFDKTNKLCDSGLQCLYENLKEYDSFISSKFSSKNKIYSVYVFNLTDNEMHIKCDIFDYEGSNLNNTYKLNSENRIGKIDLKFPKSTSLNPRISCNNDNNIRKNTNIIQIIPAKINIKPTFNNESLDETITLKAGNIKIFIDDVKALTLEGDIDNGFNGILNANENNISFIQNNKCTTNNKNITIKNPIELEFKNGKPLKQYIEFFANTITNGKLKIDFNIVDKEGKLCKDNPLNKCVSTSINSDISIIPANFLIKTDIIANNNIAYYGQLEDRNSFKFNPILNLKINPIDNNGDDMDMNSSCNYHSLELNLMSDLLIDFKRNKTDKINSNINVYMDEFKDNIVDMNIYFGISKIIDSYNNSRKIKQNDLVEPKEINLSDFKFNIKFKNNTKIYQYNNVKIFDRLIDNINTPSILIARGRIKVDDVTKTINEDINTIAKYEIYCETCDLLLLEKYLEISDPIMDNTNWYINIKHPLDLSLDKKYIKTKLNIKNISKIFDGIQEINFGKNNKLGIYDVLIDQDINKFAPYLNYNENYKNIYMKNIFKVNITKEDEKLKEKKENNLENSSLDENINEGIDIN